jgi:hypothetical protein
LALLPFPFRPPTGPSRFSSRLLAKPTALCSAPAPQRSMLNGGGVIRPELSISEATLRLETSYRPNVAGRLSMECLVAGASGRPVGLRGRNFRLMPKRAIVERSGSFRSASRAPSSERGLMDQVKANQIGAFDHVLRRALNPLHACNLL